jgi:hypothetical protein
MEPDAYNATAMTDTARLPAEARSSLPDLILYTRDGCHLCDEAREIVRSLLADRRTRGVPSPTLVERDVTTNPDWERAFLTTIPVLELRDERLELATSAARIRRLLANLDAAG